MVDKIVSGIAQFQKDVFPQHRVLFKELAGGQAPETLFITCADSRIDPSLITQALPGDLFICRNAGNVVPTHVRDAGGVTATIEYAVDALGVRHIVVCGHSDCGAMKGALHPEMVEKMPHVRDWLTNCQAAVRVVEQRHGNADEATRVARLIEENVLLQIQHLRTHPSVAGAIAGGNMTLHGWVYDIETGAVRAYDPDTGTFRPLADAHLDAGLAAERRAAAR